MLATIIAMLLAGAAQADEDSDWVRIGETTDFVTYIRAHSVKLERSTGRRLFWQRISHYKARPNGTKYTVQKRSIDCENETSRLISLVDYRADGSVIDSYDWQPYRQVERNITPGSINAALMEAVCAVDLTS